MGWFSDIMETTGKAIPNEFSKLNSYAQYLNLLFPGASAIVQAPATIDNASTAYADTKDKGGNKQQALMRALGGAQTGASGTSIDPGMYGSDGKPSRDWANVVGQIGNYLPKPGTNGKWSQGQNPLSILSNPYIMGDKAMERGGQQRSKPINMKQNFGNMSSLFNFINKEETVSDNFNPLRAQIFQYALQGNDINALIEKILKDMNKEEGAKITMDDYYKIVEGGMNYGAR